MAGRSKAIIFVYWAFYSRLYFIHSTVYRPVYNYFVYISQFWLSFRLVCIHQPQFLFFFFSFFFAILENLANFSTQRKQIIPIQNNFLKKFQRQMPICCKRKRKNFVRKKLESQASQKNYSFSHLCSNFYIQLPFE